MIFDINKITTTFNPHPAQTTVGTDLALYAQSVDPADKIQGKPFYALACAAAIIAVLILIRKWATKKKAAIVPEKAGNCWMNAFKEEFWPTLRAKYGHRTITVGTFREMMATHHEHLRPHTIVAYRKGRRVFHHVTEGDGVKQLLSVGTVGVEPMKHYKSIRWSDPKSNETRSMAFLTRMRSIARTKGFKPTDHQYTQPVGNWKWVKKCINGVEQHGMVHAGDFIPCTLVGRDGYCYLDLFQARYHLTVSSDLGEYPTTSTLYNYARVRQQWVLKDAELVVTPTIKSRMIDGVQHHIYHLAMLRMDTEIDDTRSGEAYTKELIDRNIESLEALSDARVVYGGFIDNLRRAASPDLRPVEIRPGEWTTDHEYSQTLGKWTYNKDDKGNLIKIVHTGEFEPCLYSANEGFCYSLLFKARYRRTACHQLGSWPRASELAEYCKLRNNWLETRSILTWQRIRNANHAKTKKRMVHLNHITQVWMRDQRWDSGMINHGVSATAMVKAFEGKDNDYVGGLPEYWSEAPEPLEEIPSHMINTESRFSWDYGDMNSIDERCYQCIEDAIISLAHVYDSIPFSSRVVTICNGWDVCDHTICHPSEVLSSADYGIIFYNEESHDHDSSKMHPSWRRVCIPNAPNHNLIELIALLPLVASRSDLLFANICPFKPVHTQTLLEEHGNREAAMVFDACNDTCIDRHAMIYQGSLYDVDKWDYIKLIAAHSNYRNLAEFWLSLRNPVIMNNGNYYNCKFATLHNCTIHKFMLGFRRLLNPDGAIKLVPVATSDLVTLNNASLIDAKRDYHFTNPCVHSPWVSYEEAIRRNDERLRYAQIETINWEARMFPRSGKRWSDYGAVKPQEVQDFYSNELSVPGYVWRPRDTADGLRSRLNVTQLQSLSPELMARIKMYDFPVHEPLLEILEKARDTMIVYMDSLPKGATVCVASCWSQDHYNAFRSAREYLGDFWVVLSERDYEVRKSDLHVKLPIYRGTGNIFQLSRLLPLTGRRREDVTVTCLNDMDTDWVPRDVRYNVGISALAYFDICFPAMNINMPCPFQDFTAIGGSLTQHVPSLLNTIAAYGWIYGVDEVWCASLNLPTVAVEVSLGGAATPSVDVDTNTQLHYLDNGKCFRFDTCNGNFANAIMNKPTRVSPIRTLDINLNSLPLVVNMRDFYTKWIHLLTDYYQRGGKIIVAALWGTRGDRIPLLCLLRKMRENGVPAMGFELATVKEGLEGLNWCESSLGHKMVPVVMHSRQLISRLNFPVLYPSPLGSIYGHFSFDLSPMRKESGRSRGGFIKPFDYIIPFFQSHDATFHIASTSDRGYIPRSADGHEFLQPVENIGIIEKGVVLGSSSIPVPEKYRDWPRVPSGDHTQILPNYKRIACAGGAGLVQTAKACGCKVEVWNNSIDRQWFDPNNAGAERGNVIQKDTTLLIPLTIYPSLLITGGWKYVRLMPDYIHLLNRKEQPLKKLWGLIFSCYCIYRCFIIMPTLEASLTRMILKAVGISPRPAILVMSAILLDQYFRSVRTTPLRACLSLGRQLIHVSSSPMFITLCTWGVNWLPAMVVTETLSRLPDITIIPEQIRIGRLGVHTEDSVWLIMEPIYYRSIPYAFHSAFYDTSTGTRYEGTHAYGTGIALGSVFKFGSQHAPIVSPAISVRTNLKCGTLGNVTLPAKPYSVTWNCQTICLQILLKHSTIITPIALLSCALGAISATALLALAAIIILIGTGASHFMCFILANEANERTLWEHRLQDLNRAVDRMALVAGKMDDYFVEEAEDINLANLREVSVDLLQSALLDGVDLSIAAEALRNAVAYETGCCHLINFTKLRKNSLIELTDMEYNPLRVLRDTLTTLSRLGVPPPLLEHAFRTVDAFIGTTNQSLAVLSSTIDTAFKPIAEAIDDSLGNYLGDLLSSLQQSLDVSLARKKNAWIPIPFKSPTKLRFIDWLALGMAKDFTVDQGDPYMSTINHLNKFKPHDSEPLKWDENFTRTTYRPRNPRVTSQELSYDSLLHETAYRIDPKLQERVDKYVSLGATPGTDGVWLANKDWQDDNIRHRYLAAGKPYSQRQYDLMLEVVDAMYTEHREAFEAPGVVSPGYVASQLIKKYSSGIPFMCHYPKRHNLWDSGWMNTIIQSTLNRLKEGTYPQQIYHNFPKMQIGTKPRMVTAEGLASSFVSQVTQLEPDKRPVWSTANMGMGAPINAQYLGEVFEKIASRETAFTADVTDYDSNTPPLIFEGLHQLRLRGVRAGGVEGSASIQRCKYYAMQNATMLNLETGSKIAKNRGGGTGQSATSFDNHWGFRMSMIMLWCEVTGLPASQFYHYNTVHNTGDDNVWGTDSDIKPEQLSQAAKSLLGFDLRIETQGDVTNLSYLSRKCMLTSDHEEDSAIAGITSKYIGVFDRSRMLLRRSAVTSRFSGKPSNVYHKHLLERSIGHLINTAFDRELYSIIIEEYMEDAAQFVGVQDAIIWDLRKDKNGFILAAHPSLNKCIQISRAAESRFSKLKSSLKAPTYEKVLQIAGKEYKPTPPISKHKASRVMTSTLQLISAHLSSIRISLNAYLPDYLGRLKTKPDTLPLSQPTYMTGYPIEKYIWTTAWNKGIDLTQSELSIRCRESPFAPATDSDGFYWYIQIPGIKDKILNEDYHVIRGRCITAFMTYMLVGRLADLGRQNPLLGVLINLYMIFRRELPRYYSALSSSYWILTATVSHQLASLMPQDPYAFMKLIAIAISNVYPPFILKQVSVCIPEKLISNAIDTIGLIIAYRPISPFQDSNFKRSNPWEGLTDGILTELNFHKNIVVSAPTATGKSTLFVSSLFNRTQERIWILVPRKLLRQNYCNPIIHPWNILKMERGSIDNGQRVVVCTYGHLLAKLRTGYDFDERDILLFDEFHENMPEQGLVNFKLKNRKIAMSATPNLIYANNWRHIATGIPRPYGEPETTIIDASPEALHHEANALYSSDITSRTLYIVPSLKEAARFHNTLLSINVMSTLVSRDSRSVPKTGSIVATQVVDSGIDIDPPVNLVIDTGEMIASHKGNLIVRPTDLATLEQRKGRTGRRGKGYYITTPRAGTGAPVIPYPSWSLLADDDHDRNYIITTLGISMDIEKPDNPLKLDPFVTFNIQLPDNVQRSLEALWYLRCETGSIERGAISYDSIVLRGFSEESDYLRQKLKDKFGNEDLLPREKLNKHIGYRPFSIKTKNNEYRKVSLILLRNDRVFGV